MSTLQLLTRQLCSCCALVFTVLWVGIHIDFVCDQVGKRKYFCGGALVFCSADAHNVGDKHCACVTCNKFLAVPMEGCDQ